MKTLTCVFAALVTLASFAPAFLLAQDQQSTTPGQIVHTPPPFVVTPPPVVIDLPAIPVTPYVPPSWVNVTYPLNNFYAVNGMSWTVSNATTNKYMLFGKTLFWMVQAGPSSVGGTKNAELRVNLPNGWKVATSFTCPIAYLEDSATTAQAGFVFGNVGLGYVSLYKSNFANWNYTNVNNTIVNFQCFFEIQ